MGARPAAIAAFAPGAATAFTAIDLHVLHAQPLMYAAGAVGLAAAAAYAVFLADRSGWGALGPVLIFSSLAAYGLAAEFDVALAPPGAKVFPVLVSDKYASGSRSRSYNLKVSAWSDQAGGPISVPEAYYDNTTVGALVCVFRHPGALGFDWFDVRDCPAGTRRPPSVTAAAPGPPASGGGPQSYYPEGARQARQEGRAVVRCRVVEEVKLTDCSVMSETPPGLGFGLAAVKLLEGPGVHVKPSEVKGHGLVSVPVAFKLKN